ncbi:mitogen-activated protein kinase [Stylonychia lemnae]|uniref:Mitogen-activated protein kinase n=1 Tax=Stylonychia lemnae TaxID=5949 RepID=A0A078ACS2_STYLE|nr:mitogen-activated protein kinase [Stylonychia lemnae]|eukprot:CDW78638.1 mitogen-activated protein kinase [Stylonychia lemnae]
MDKQSRLFLQPFIKSNAVNDYIIVDSIFVPDSDLLRFKAYHKAQNQLVEIIKEKVLITEVNIKRLKAYIIALEQKLLQLFDFLLEVDMLNANYIYVYKIKLVKQEQYNDDISIFKLEDFLNLNHQEMDMLEKIQILQSIIKLTQQHQYLTKCPILCLTLDNITVKRISNDFLIGLNSLEVDISRIIALQKHDNSLLNYLPPEHLFNSQEYHSKCENDNWMIGLLIFRVLFGYDVFQMPNTQEKLNQIIKIIGLPKSQADIPYCNQELYTSIFDQVNSIRSRSFIDYIQFQDIDQQGNLILADVLKRLLCWNPLERMRLSNVSEQLHKLKNYISQPFGNNLQLSQSISMKQESLKNSTIEGFQIFKINTQNSVFQSNKVQKSAEDTELEFSISQKLSTNRLSSKQQNSPIKHSASMTFEKLMDKQQENILNFQKLKARCLDYQKDYQQKRRQQSRDNSQSEISSFRLLPEGSNKLKENKNFINIQGDNNSSAYISPRDFNLNKISLKDSIEKKLLYTDSLHKNDDIMSRNIETVLKQDKFLIDSLDERRDKDIRALKLQFNSIDERNRDDYQINHNAKTNNILIQEQL